MEENRGKSRKRDRAANRRMMLGILFAGIVVLLVAGTAGWLHRQSRQDREEAVRMADLQREAARNERTGPGDGAEQEAASEVELPTGSGGSGISGPEGEEKEKEKGKDQEKEAIRIDGGMDPQDEHGAAGKTGCVISFAGDIYLSDHVMAAYRDAGGIGGVLDEGLRNAIAESDLFLANEEFPFSDGGVQAKDKQFTFRLPTKDVHILKEAGLSAVTLANNHVLDYGTEALLDTLRTLKEAGIPYTGAGGNLEEAEKLLILEAGGKKIGVLAASRVYPDAGWAAGPGHPGVFSAYDLSGAVRAVKEARSQCDYLIVCIHWGIERHTEPEAYQRQNGHALIDAGADLVVGSHPHVLQGIEFYQGKPIFYSMGNFIFGSSIPSTMLGQVILDGEGNPTFRVIPASSSRGFTHRIPEEAAFYASLRALSRGVRIAEDGTVAPEAAE